MVNPTTAKAPASAPAATAEGLFGALCSSRYLSEAAQKANAGAELSSSVRAVGAALAQPLQRLAAQTPQDLEKLGRDGGTQTELQKTSTLLLLAGHTLGQIIQQSGGKLGRELDASAHRARALLQALNKELLTLETPLKLRHFEAFKHLCGECIAAADCLGHVPVRREPIPQTERTADPERRSLFSSGVVAHQDIWVYRSVGTTTDAAHLPRALFSAHEALARVRQDAEAIVLKPGPDAAHELREWGRRCSVGAEIVREVLHYSVAGLAKFPEERRTLQNLHAQLAAAAGCCRCLDGAPDMRTVEYMRQTASQFAQHPGFAEFYAFYRQVRR